MARRGMRGVEFICDCCGQIEWSDLIRNLMPPGWTRLTRRFTLEGTFVENSVHQDLCPVCADRVDDALDPPQTIG